MRPDCYDECAARLIAGFAREGIEATVSHLPPLLDSGYERLQMTCPHGVEWFTEPTSEQIARWAERGIQ